MEFALGCVWIGSGQIHVGPQPVCYAKATYTRVLVEALPIFLRPCCLWEDDGDPAMDAKGF